MKPIVTVMLIVLTAFCQAECPIECFCDRVTTCTGDKLLTRFPKIYSTLDSSSVLTAVPIRVEYHDYAVKHLSRQDFLDIISNLTEISISRNSLETFDNETFSLEFTTFSSTSTVSHERREIAGTSKSVAGDEQQKTFFTFPLRSSRAESFNVHNPDAFLDSGTFLQLKILDLSQNKLKYFVGGGRLRKLKILDLSSNMLQQVYELSAMESLESVNLRDNRISYLEANIFQNLRNLQYVNLDSNVLGFVHPSTFSNLPSLAHLILSSNPISNLLPGFYWNSRVQFVDVSNVGLTSIPPSLTKTVRDFRCANNNLTIIRQTDFESYPNVGLLVLDENAIEIVEDDAFGRLDFLSRLWINANRLKRIPQNLPPSLRSLQLEDNRIVNLSSTDFKNLKNLEELNLHSNRISSIPPFVFSELTNLKSLDLRSNLIDVIYRDSFANLSKLETLDISQNPIKVIVTGAFGSLRKVTLLHLSRLMEPIELDVSSFQPLQNLQILELDDSPHLVQKLFQDSGLAYLSNIYEINVQRCELEDVNLVSNALLELNLRSIKISGNPWDCEDLQGSSVQELMSRRVVVDDPTCDHPSSLHGTHLASLNITIPKASLNVIASREKQPNFTQPFVTPLTRTGDSMTENFTSSLSPSGRSLDPREHSTATPSPEANAQHTNPPEKVANATYERKTGGQGISEQPSSVSLLDTAIVMTKPRVSFSFKNAYPARGTVGVVSSNASQTDSSITRAGVGHDSFSPIGVDRQRPSSKQGPAFATTEANTFVDLDGDVDVVPTQSYFDYPSRNSTKNDENSDERDSSVSGRGNGNLSGRQNKGTTSISSNRRKPPMNLMPINNATTGQRTRRPAAKARSSEETKTNDDNTIIDESQRRRLHTGNREETQEARATQRSIDGFPLAYPDSDRVAKKAPSGSDVGVSNPKYSYLKLQDNFKIQRRSDLPYDNTSSAHMAVIVKTLVISALTCLGSILCLFLISLAIYRYSLKINGGVFSCTRQSSTGEEEDTQQQGAGMVYTRFGRKKSRRRDSFTGYGSSHYHQQESDSDQVELSGITNSLYFENEDIYHIT